MGKSFKTLGELQEWNKDKPEGYASLSVRIRQSCQCDPTRKPGKQLEAERQAMLKKVAERAAEDEINKVEASMQVERIQINVTPVWNERQVVGAMQLCGASDEVTEKVIAVLKIIHPIVPYSASGPGEWTSVDNKADPAKKE